MNKTLSNKEKRQINEEIKRYSFQFDKKQVVQITEDEGHKLIKLEDRSIFFFSDDKFVPTLKLLLDHDIDIKKVVVDMGAVKFIANGADIMRPGIVDIDEDINNEEIIKIVDQNNQKPLAIGKALFSAKEMKEKKQGKVIENIHFIGDDIWQS